MKMFYAIKIILLIITICIWVNFSFSENLDKNFLIQKFDQFDLAINKGNGYINYTNEDGALAWAQAPLLESYLDLYIATKNNFYINKFVIQANSIVSKTDKERDIKDYKGRLRTGWSAIKYSKDKKTPLIHLVHTGMILYPLINFINLIRTENSNSYKEISDIYFRVIKEAVSEFENQWRYNVEKDEGYYCFEGDEPLLTNLKDHMPFNHNLAIGRVLVKLYRITKKEEYLKKCEALGNFFKKNITINLNDGYIWGYRPNLHTHHQIEDISHGAIDVEFAIEMFRNNLVFTYEDMKKFIKTFLNLKKNGKFYKYVNATDDPTGRINPNAPGDLSDSIGRWLELSEFDCVVYKVGFEYLMNRIKNSKKEHPQLLLGISKLIKYYDKCKGKD